MRGLIAPTVISCLLSFVVSATAAEPRREGPLAAGRGVLKITVIDVWQGDSILIETPSGRRILVDAGEGSTSYASYDAPDVNIIPFLRRNAITSNDLNTLVLTHPHHDHIGGALSILDRYAIRTVFDTGMPYATDKYLRILRRIEERNIRYIVPKPGDRLDWDPALEVLVLNSASDVHDEPNNNSLVLRIKYGRFTMLLTGDAETEAETDMINSGLPLRSLVLKAGHHASDTSSGEDFLDAVRPETVIVSVGLNNKFSHPSPDVLERYGRRGFTVWRTDRHGDITIESDGEHYTVRAEKK
jgi:beta-lactamase superfamily II metal-dependent hydrolase